MPHVEGLRLNTSYIHCIVICLFCLQNGGYNRGMNAKAVKIINIIAVLFLTLIVSFIVAYLTSGYENKDTAINTTEAIVDITPTLIPFEMTGEAKDGYIEGEVEFIESQKRIAVHPLGKEIEEPQGVTWHENSVHGQGVFQTLDVYCKAPPECGGGVYKATNVSCSTYICCDSETGYEVSKIGECIDSQKRIPSSMALIGTPPPFKNPSRDITMPPMEKNVCKSIDTRCPAEFETNFQCKDMVCCDLGNGTFSPEYKDICSDYQNNQ